MWCKWLWASVIVMLIFSCVDPALAKDEDKKDSSTSILYIYTDNAREDDPFVRQIELLLYHFSAQVMMKRDNEVTDKDVKQASTIIYYGGTEKELQTNITSWLDDFHDSVFIIGENVEQFDSYRHFQIEGEVPIQQLQFENDKEVVSLDRGTDIYRVQPSESIRALVTGLLGDEAYPLLVSDENHRYYFAAKNLNNVFIWYIAEFLHEIIPNNHEEMHEAYLQLEGIHPKSDPEKIRNIGQTLNEKDIPYQLVVTPVYSDPETGSQTRLSDVPVLVEVLQDLQSENGVIVAHGYTNGSYSNETYRGAEFWDLEKNQFVFEEVTEQNDNIRKEDEFASEQAYEEYLAPLKEYEASFIGNRLNSALIEFVDNDLYPLAFQVPNDAVSDQGYDIISQYFSSMFGAIQFSDVDWQKSGTAPFITTASYLHGIQLYPDTIGAIDTTASDPLRRMKEKMKYASIVRDSSIGGSYHVYLDDQYLDEVLELYDRIPEKEWLDVKKTEQNVTTEDIEIMSQTDGSLTVEDETTWWGKWFSSNQSSMFEKVLWIVTILVGVFVVLFFSFVIRLRLQLKKRLFEERKHHG